ncbi:MAG: GNAT family N-acetyltransferase, partial [Chitinophagaceae bacterium]
MDTAQQVNVRFATKEDAPMIAELSRRTFLESFAEQNTAEDMEKFMTEQFTYERLVQEVGAPSNIFIVAEVLGKVAGYARLRESTGPEILGELPNIEIARIYALQTMIGKGIG